MNNTRKNYNENPNSSTKKNHSTKKKSWLFKMIDEIIYFFFH